MLLLHHKQDHPVYWISTESESLYWPRHLQRLGINRTGVQQGKCKQYNNAPMWIVQYFVESHCRKKKEKKKKKCVVQLHRCDRMVCSELFRSFVCHAAFVWTALKNFLDLNRSSRQWPGWEGSIMIFPACFLVQYSNRPWLEGSSLHLIIFLFLFFFKEHLMHCSLPLAWAPNQTIIEEIRMELVIAV